METLKKKRTRALLILDILNGLYSEAECTLDFADPLQLLISTQLAAQCTDARVNLVTRTLYQKYRSASDFANAELGELEQEIRSTGFYHNKARNIINCCRAIEAEYGGRVPQTMETLLKLPGVGRKTANLVLGDAFGMPGIVVDTHAGRLARRLGLTAETDPEKVEYALAEVIPKESWTRFGHQLVLHGRAVCPARKPRCGQCALASCCPKTGVGETI
ncbi:MAG: endonuclease III [Clostridiales bacterium]|nr:endonuclease III [Clostridiales bacterium]